MSANSTYMYMTAYKQRQNTCSSFNHKKPPHREEEYIDIR